jgi:polysaccharide pyruvyl transferase WcaK-like protein
MKKYSIVSPRLIVGNRGDVLSRWGIIETLARSNTYRISVFASREQHLPSGIEAVYPYGYFFNFIPRSIRSARALWNSKAVVWTGGLDLQDDSSLAKLIYLWGVFLSYRCISLRIVCLNQGAGPITTPLGRFFATRVLSMVDTFLARDKATAMLVSQLSPSTNVVLAYDGIFLPGFDRMPSVARSDQRALDHIEAARKHGPVIGVNVRRWFHFASRFLPYQLSRTSYNEQSAKRMDFFLEAMTILIRQLSARTDAQFVFLSMYEPNTDVLEDDIDLLTDLAGRVALGDRVTVLNEDLSPQGLMSVFSRLDFMIGTRLHSTLAAIRMGCPSYHIAYTLKGHDVYNDLGLSDCTVDIDDFIRSPQTAADQIESMIQDSSLKERIVQSVGRILALNESMIRDSVMSTLSRGR